MSICIENHKFTLISSILCDTIWASFCFSLFPYLYLTFPTVRNSYPITLHLFAYFINPPVCTNLLSLWSPPHLNKCHPQPTQVPTPTLALPYGYPLHHTQSLSSSTELCIHMGTSTHMDASSPFYGFDTPYYYHCQVRIPLSSHSGSHASVAPPPLPSDKH